jgi:DNA-binding LacI/PurR family transcriptional regulator
MRVHEAGRDKAARKAYQIALLLFHVNDYPQIGYLHGFQSALHEQDRLLLCDTRNAGEREVRILEKLALEADAICCYPTGSPDSTKLLLQIAAAGKPIVLIDRVPDGAVNIDAVMTDNYAATRTALEALKARGHDRIAFLTTENDRVSSVRDRKNAFRSVLLESGLSDSKIGSLIRSFPMGTGYDFDSFGQGIHDALFTLLHLSEPPTAIFCLEDYFLWAALEACDKMGLRVPGDLEILGFSDCPPMVPRLSQNVHRIVQATSEMGEIAANRIYRRLNGESMDSEIILSPAVFHPASILNFPLGNRSLIL